MIFHGPKGTVAKEELSLVANNSRAQEIEDCLKSNPANPLSTPVELSGMHRKSYGLECIS